MNADFLVIGSGIAGMSTALRLAGLGSVTLVSKRDLTSGSTPLAQGGIAAPLQEEDSTESHREDTIRVGGGLGDPDAIDILVAGADEAIGFLESCGVRFSNVPHHEAGHSRPRIRHVGDSTGAAISNALANRVRNSESIGILEQAFVSDLLVRDQTVYGAEVYHQDRVLRIFASRTILATGGAGQVYEETTNPPESTGDGMVLAVKAGAKLADMEFVQFHPTALATEEKPLFLLSETLRGEGALIVDSEGTRLCDPLLPRDELSRRIFSAEQQGTPIFLDLKHHSDEYWQQEFPVIFSKLQEYGLSPQKDLIPIIPAAHFFCGGVETTLLGRTSVKHLSAVGEVARSGVHGANRLASNSLLEGVVFSRQIFCDYQEQVRRDKMDPPVTGGHFETTPFVPEAPEDAETRRRIRKICWKKAGVIRKMPELDEAVAELSELTAKGSETKNMLTVATLVVEAARKRKESVGCHYVV